MKLPEGDSLLESLVEILDADELLVASEDHLLIGQSSRVVTIFGASKSVA